MKAFYWLMLILNLAVCIFKAVEEYASGQAGPFAAALIIIVFIVGIDFLRND